MRHLFAALAAALTASFASPASAWIETNARGLVSTLEVARDGSATVGHELLLEVRGGPLKKLELATSDTDAELLPDASVTRVNNGVSLPLIVERRGDGSLGLEVDHERGLRSGTYNFVVRYRTNLRTRGLLAARRKSTELSWTGPRLESGVDGVRTILRLPPADVVPRLPAVGDDDADTGFGVLVSAIRRSAEHDEIELVRSHVARGEPVLWRVEAGPGAFLVAPEVEAARVSIKAPAAAPPLAPRSQRWLAAALLAGIGFFALVWRKERTFARACALGRAAARALVPAPLFVRAPLAGLCFGAALYLGAKLEEPTFGGAALLAAFALASLARPRRSIAPRRPGRWLPLKGDDAFAGKAPSLPGASLDAGTLRGLGVLALALAGVVAIAACELRSSPYRALFVLLAGLAALVAVFFTGRGSDVIADRVAFSRRFMQRLERRLRDDARWKAVPWGRVPEGQSAPDELRLLVQPRGALEGLVALEAALEPKPGLGGTVAAPFVIVRAKEDSPAQRALPPGVVWTRGRRPDERVAILSPNLPTLGLTLSLIERLVGLLVVQRPSKSARSSGSSALTRKLGKVASPAHAM